jgi:PKHD-type hydroxylase
MNLTFNARSVHYSTPPYAYWDGWFSEKDLDKILNYCSFIEKSTGKIGSLTNTNSQNLNLRNSLISFIKYDPLTQWLFDELFNLTETINRHFFKYDLQGFDYLQYTEYSKGCHYGYHTDMIFGDGLSPEEMLPRKLSFSLILSDRSEFEGGDLEFYTGKNETIVPEQKLGRVIAFPSFMLHQVTPVIEGNRKSLVFWALGPKFK